MHIRRPATNTPHPSPPAMLPQRALTRFSRAPTAPPPPRPAGSRLPTRRSRRSPPRAHRLRPHRLWPPPPPPPRPPPPPPSRPSRCTAPAPARSPAYPPPRSAVLASQGAFFFARCPCAVLTLRIRKKLYRAASFCPMARTSAARNTTHIRLHPRASRAFPGCPPTGPPPRVLDADFGSNRRWH